ncbi:Spy/CpxP family protein refolding chaperone [Rhizobium sp. LjRoot254]|uniref:Spy/CpxP family protein refolding chaperone n=1 Tax=Rhizobium sp. LjRoot254 TaxID=3342297 RepID=UPI003ED0DB4A
MPKPLILIMAAILSSDPALAGESHHEHIHSPPYAGEQTREIKALSKEDIDELLRGGGWGLAKSAELNGMPGPTHVLDMAAELDLSAEQIERTRKMRNAMRREAKQIGERVVVKEAELESRFRVGDIVEAELMARVSEIEALRAKLRTAHLLAHIEMARVLSADQIERYAVLRGYR